MHKSILFAALLGILTAGTGSAQISSRLSQPVQNHRSPHIDSLRRVLKLSPHLHLNWKTSQNGVDVLSVTDDFNRDYVGDDWGRNPEFWQIVDGELDLTDAAIYSFRYLAAFLPVYNAPERRIHSVSYRWGRNADDWAITEGSHALMLDQPNENGSGYWLWHRTNWLEVWLWIVKNGTWEYTPQTGKQVDTTPSLSGNPQAGDVVTAYIRQEPDAVYFDYYVNDRLDGTVKDVTKEYPKSDYWHVGVFLYGRDPFTLKYLNNQVDDFTVTWLEVDVIPPAAINDLQATDTTATSIKLKWTSTGDNGVDGNATRLELRYSTSPITTANFMNAELAPNLPEPASPGSDQTFELTNLDHSTTYYFALKIFDEMDNASPLSNIAQARTHSAATQLLVINGSQTGTVGANLPAQLVAKVTDDNGVGVSNSPVEFVVISGNGTVGGKKNLAVNTDGAGEAKATWKLGTIAGMQTVEIRANGLNGSPKSCTAIAKAATPAKLLTVSGNGQIVAVGKTAPSPLIMRLIDQYGNLNANHAVMFHITAGGGYFLNGQISAGKIYQTLTDSNGQALAKVVAGNTYNDTTKVTVKWTSSSGATTLTTSFIIVAAKPDSAFIVKGNNQTAARNTVLPESLMVRLFDAANAPVKNYPVTFTVKSGGGKLIGNKTQVTVNTGGSGYARMSWLLGNVAGAQQVEASAAFNNKNLRNTPLVFKAMATIPTGTQDKEITLPQQFALHQNFPNPFNRSAERSRRSLETTIYFDLPEAGAVVMNVIDVTGRQVRQLFAGEMPAGSHRLIWNGQDDAGRAAESGVYFFVLRAKHAAEEFVATRKVILMK